MKIVRNDLSNAIRFALIAGLGSTAAQVAVAQSESTTLDTVQVTGSRIKRTDRETAQPVLVISRDEIVKSGKPSIGELLQSLPEVGPALTTAVNNGGNGATNVSLRNLGAARTLVLMNGRRWAPDINGTTDLNTIPTSIVQSIEVLKDGASAIYGSDAIAGVINVITRSDFDGATVNGFYGQFDEGDGTRYSADFTIGASSERGSISLNASFVNEDEVGAGDRAISAVPNFGLDPLATGSTNTPFGQFGIGASGGFTFDANGRPVGPGPSNAPATATGPNTSPTAANPLSNYRRFNNATDLYNFAPDNYLITPQERASIFVQGRYQLTEWLNFDAHAMYNNRKSAQELAPMPVSLGLQPGASGLAATVRAPANNPYNPFGAEVTRIGRRFNEFGPRRFVQDKTTFRFGAGFSGDFSIADRFVSWESGYSYTRNSEPTTTAGLFNVARLRDALSAIDDPRTTAFDPICVLPGTTAQNFTPGAVRAGCVPINIFGGLGSITPAMLNYVTFTAQDNRETETTNYYLNTSTVLASYDAGDLAIAFGYEHRKEQGFDLPDAIIAAGETTGNSRSATSGNYSLDEFYAELAVPLLRDVPFAQVLEARLAARYSDFTNFGDTSNFAAGFQWKPIDDLKIRGNFNEGFRAPTIQDLFRGQSDSFPALADPCARGFGSYANQLTETQNRCRGLVPGFGPTVPSATVNGVATTAVEQPNQQIRITLGGEPNLVPEESESTTLGLVYSPEWVPGLDLTLDYWRIKIENRLIASRGAGVLLTQCYRDNNPEACARIRRDSTGQVSDVLATNENAGVSDTRGIDFGLVYQLPEYDFGQFRVNWDTTYYIQDDRTNLGFNPAAPFAYHNNNPITQFVGFLGATPRIRSVANLAWSLGPWSADWKMRYQHRAIGGCAVAYQSLSDDCAFETLRTAPFTNAAGQVVTAALPRDSIGSVTYHDLSFAYQTPWETRIRVGVNNAFAKDPPIARDGTTNSYDSVTYDVPGRFWFVTLSHSF